MPSSSRNRRAAWRLGLSRLAGCDQSEDELVLRRTGPYGYFVSPQGLGLVPSHRDYSRAEEGLLEVHWFRFAPAGK
jgi:hypothetical protein